MLDNKRAIWCLIVSLITRMATAQVDAGAGTYSCYPCGRGLCGFKNGGSPDVLIDPIANGFGTNIARDVEALTCQELQQKADSRTLDPELCSLYASVVRSSADPCECKERTQLQEVSDNGNPCVKPAQADECNLCGRKNGVDKVIGDPDKILPAYGVSCASIFDSQRNNMDNGGSGYGALCSDFQVAFGAQVGGCKCVLPSELSSVDTCIPTEDIHGPRPCNNDSDCCVGHCRYIDQWKSHGKVCTGREDESHLMEQGWTNPTQTPYPTQAPFFQAPPLNPSPPLNQSLALWGDYGCFSGSTLVHRQTSVIKSEWVPLDRVQVGDIIQVSSDKFEPIYAFGHYQPEREGPFIEVKFDNKQQLQISEEHLIWTPNNGAITAENLKLGQEVLLAGGQATSVTGLERITAKGVYAPFTSSGTLVLNHGLMASSYTSMTPWTKLPLIPSAYHHAVSHFFTFPHRFFCQNGCPNPTYNQEGINVWEVQLLWWIQRTAVFSLLLLGVAMQRRWLSSSKV